MTVPETNMMTPEALVSYVGARIMLPGGNVFAPGQMKSREQDDNGNVVKRANANPNDDVEASSPLVATCQQANEPPDKKRSKATLIQNARSRTWAIIVPNVLQLLCRMLF